MEEPLLLLPGMMCDARLYGPQIAHFSSSRPVMVMSLTGHQSFASLAEAILDKAPPRFALAGLSMGGICAMEMVRQAPNRVSRLALMDTNPLPDPPERAGIRQSQVERVMAGDLREVIRDEMKPNYLADTPRKREVLDLCMEMALTLGPKVFADQSQALMHRPDQCETLKKINVPTLILCGRSDRLCPLERHTLMQSLIDGSRLVVIEEAGHLPTLEQPQETIGLLEEWLQN